MQKTNNKRIKKIAKKRIISQIMANISWVIVFISFFGIIGGIGNFDFAEETGEIISHEEEIRIWTSIIVAIIVGGIAAVCGTLFTMSAAEAELDEHLLRSRNMIGG